MYILKILIDLLAKHEIKKINNYLLAKTVL